MSCLKKLRPIHFVPANGFPMHSYGKVFDLVSKSLENSIPEHKEYAKNQELLQNQSPLIGGCDVYSIANQSNYSFTTLVNHTISSIETRQIGKVTGVGHSFGGVLMICCAIKRPDLFHQLIIGKYCISLPDRFNLLYASRLSYVQRV